MKHALALCTILAIPAAASAQASSSEAEAMAEPILRQLRLEAAAHYYQAYPDGTGLLSIRGRPRGAGRAGLCVSDEVEIRVASPHQPSSAPAGAPARIRSLTAKRYYHALLDPHRAPRRDASGDVLDRACAAPDATGTAFEAEDADEADRALGSLPVAVAELRKPASPIVRLRCGRIAFCPTSEEAAVRTDVVRPSLVHVAAPACPRKLACVTAMFLSGPGSCDIWLMSVASEPADPRNVRRIEIRYGGIVFECRKFPEQVSE